MGPSARCSTSPSVRLASRSISPPWGSIRFRLAPRTYDAPPFGPSVRVVPGRQTESRKIPTRKLLPLLIVPRPRDLPRHGRVVDVDEREQAPLLPPVLAPRRGWRTAPLLRLPVRAPSRSTPPQMGAKWGSIRFRPLACTCAPWGCVVRGDELAKSRKYRSETLHCSCPRADTSGTTAS